MFMLRSMLQILYSETFTGTASAILSLKNIYIQVFNHAVQLKLLQGLNNDSRASSLGFHWRMETKSIPCSIPVPFLISKLEQKNKSKHVPGLVCAENIFASWASGCDVTQMAKNSSAFGIETIPFLRGCQLGEVRTGSSTPCVRREMLPILAARRDTLQMIPVGGIPQHNPQPQGDSRRLALKFYGRGRILSPVNFPTPV